MTDAQIELAQPEDSHTRAEWERSAAAVLRKSGRLTDEDPDSAVWDKLTRTTTFPTCRFRCGRLTFSA
jgi:methylmalonyl-CoA mutase